AEVREAVLELRRGKGMVLDAADHDTWSAGSFFTNPVLDDAGLRRVPAEAPRWATGDGRTKVSAAWLIEHAGLAKGYGLPGPASLSTKHTLALTNRAGRARQTSSRSRARCATGCTRPTACCSSPNPCSWASTSRCSSQGRCERLT